MEGASILDYAQPASSGGLPTTFYPGPGAPAARARTGAGAVLVAALVLLIVILACVCHRRRRFEPARGGRGGPPTPLARRLAARGWAVYYLRGCGYCDRQAALLGDFGRETVYEPDGAIVRRGPAMAGEAPLPFGEIGGFPHWHNAQTGEDRPGFQDAASLAQMAA